MTIFGLIEIRLLNKEDRALKNKATKLIRSGRKDAAVRAYREHYGGRAKVTVASLERKVWR